MTTENRRTYSIPVLAQLAGVSKTRLYKLAEDGKLPGALRIGDRLLVSRKVADAWLDGELEEAGPAA